VTQQQRQRLVLAKLIEIFGTLAAHIANGLSIISDTLNPRLRLFTRASRSITAAVPVCRNASINPGTPAWARNQRPLQLDIDLEIQPIGHPLPPASHGSNYHLARTQPESVTCLQIRANPLPLAGD
jgi:hypothetical protein